MRIEKEDDLLNQEIRKKIIDDIKSSENQGRKDEAYKRYQCYKDMTAKYVVAELLKQFDGSTVEEMSYAVANISVVKKIIDKLARVYNSGVKRNAGSDELTSKIELLSEELELNTTMRKVNKYLKLQKNVCLFVKPVPYEELPDGSFNYIIKLVVLQPYLYDVIEQYHDRECPMAYVLSHYSPTGNGVASLLATNIARAGRAFLTPTIKSDSDNKDESIGNKAADKDIDSKEYIFWSKKYHFTCNGKGEIVKSTIGENDEPTPDNPIQMLPMQEFALDQDGVFWAEGGSDLVAGAILINCMITNLNHIGITQGYGQFFAKGKGLPKQFKLGPNKAITMEMQSKDDPIPEIGFATANPPLKELMSTIEMYVALLLTTNNLTATGISSRLDNFKQESSGIALIIDKSESMEDVQDQQQIFIEREPLIFEKIAAWLTYYGARNQLYEDFIEFKDLPEELDISLKFTDAQPIMSETEKINNIILREKMGLNTLIELLMKDDTALTEKDAEAKLLKILEDRLKNKELWDAIASGGAQPQTQQDPMLNDNQKNMDNPTGSKSGAAGAQEGDTGGNKGAGGSGKPKQNGQ